MRMKNVVDTEKVQFHLKIPKARGSKNFFNIIINDIDEETYIAAQSMVKADKSVEAVKFILKELHAGGDDVMEVLDCFHALHATSTAILELLAPAEVELKKK